MDKKTYFDIACRYCVDDLPGASVMGARLQKILDNICQGQPLTRWALAFLQEQGLQALHRLASGTLPDALFRELALTEQVQRIAQNNKKCADESDREAQMWARLEAERLAAQVQFEAERLARESDPKYIAKMKQQKLRKRYGINGYVKPDCFGRLMTLLKQVDVGQRLSPEDWMWLSTSGIDYFTPELRAAAHRLEADFWVSEFKQTDNPWAVVNASSHYRKCACAREADTLLKTLSVQQQTSRKLKSALCTTHGGVKRDLKCFDEALRFGEQAHAFRSDDYRPCTLLGAVHMETGDFSLGREWYAKAIERGATLDDVDRELRAIFSRLEPAMQRKMCAFLLADDPIRYQWMRLKLKL